MLHDYVKNFTDQIENGRHDLSPILADVLEDDSLHGDQQTLDHLRSGEPVYLTQHEGKHFARKKDDVHDKLLSAQPYVNRPEAETDLQGTHLRRHSILSGLEGSNHPLDVSRLYHTLDLTVRSNRNLERMLKNKTYDPINHGILPTLLRQAKNKHDKIPENTLIEHHNSLIEGNLPNHYKWETHPDQVVNALHEYYNHQYSPSERHLSRDDIEDQVHAAWKVKSDKTPLERQLPFWEKLIDSEHDIQHKRLTRNTQEREHNRNYRGPL